MADKRLWELLAKQFNGQLSEEELDELQRLIKQEQEPIPYGDLLSELHHLSLRVTPDDKTAKSHSLETLLKTIGKDHPEETVSGSRRRKNIVPWLVLTTLLLTTGYLIKKNQPKGGSAEPFHRIVTKAGSRTLINLPDSSTVILNSACQFAYNKDFGVKKREMQLTGEAWFDVHGNPDMPLVLNAGNVIIRVLGTSFNVRAYVEDSFVEATLVRGVIEVSLKTDPERKILLRPNEKIVIRNEAEKETHPIATTLKTPREEVIRVTQVEPDPKDSSYIETAWMKEKLVFRKESFVSLSKRLERWYQVKIVFADSSLQSLLFTGSFEKETVEEAFRALQHSAPFSYDINGKTITITKSK